MIESTFQLSNLALWAVRWRAVWSRKEKRKGKDDGLEMSIVRLGGWGCVRLGDGGILLTSAERGIKSGSDGRVRQYLEAGDGLGDWAGPVSK